MKRFNGWSERERRIVAAIFVGGVLAGGCSSNHLLGDVGVGGSAGGTGGEALGLGGQAGRSGPDRVDAGFPGDVSPLGASQTWTGYLENFQFPSGSDSVKVSFATDTSGIVVGTVTFGAGSPPPPATDPDGIYPPGATQVTPPTVVEGFPYNMARGTLEASRLRFTIWETEVWSGWCALQSGNSTAPWCLTDVSVYSYNYNTDGTCSYQLSPGGQPIAINCAKMMLCQSSVCDCSTGACTANYFGDVEFDVALSVNGANGSISGQFGDHNVRLTQSASP